MTRGRQRARAVALGSIAVAAVFGIGFFAGREVSRSPVAAPRDEASLDAAVAPELLGYRLLLSVPVDLERPRGIASLDDGTICVCGDRALLAVERTGAVRARFAIEGEPTCVAAGGDGRFYVGAHDHVEVVDPATGGVTLWPDLGPRAIVTSIAVTASGVFVADAGNRMVLRFDRGGRLAGEIGSGYVVPSPWFDLAPAPDGTLVVADPGARRVRRYSPEGKLLGSWGASSPEVDGFAGCCNPVHLAVLPCGSVVTSEKGVLRVKVHEADGRLEAVVATPADFPSSESSLDLATRRAEGGEILVLVPLERAVRIYVHREVASDG
jgi:hypothetical protein